MNIKWWEFFIYLKFWSISQIYFLVVFYFCSLFILSKRTPIKVERKYMKKTNVDNARFLVIASIDHTESWRFDGHNSIKYGNIDLALTAGVFLLNVVTNEVWWTLLLQKKLEKIRNIGPSNTTNNVSELSFGIYMHSFKNSPSKVYCSCMMFTLMFYDSVPFNQGEVEALSSGVDRSHFQVWKAIMPFICLLDA